MSELKSEKSTPYTEYMKFFKTQNDSKQDPVTEDVVREIVGKLQKEVVSPLNLISALDAKALSRATQDACARIGAVISPDNSPTNR